MQTYKAFLKIALKSAPSVAIYFVIFMFISIMSASQGQSSEKEIYKDAEIKFTVFNRDNSKLGDAIKDYLSEKNEFVEVEDNEEAIRLALYYRMVYYILVIPEGFEAAIEAGNDMEFMNYKVSDSAQGYYMDMEAEGYMQTLKAYIASGYDMTQATEKTKSTLMENIEVTILEKNEDKVEDEDIEGNPISSQDISDKPSSYYFYQYVPYVFLAIVISGLGPIIITFGKKDVKMRINVSSQTFKSYSIQMFLGVITFGLVVLALFNVLGFIMYGTSLSFAAIVYYLILTFCFLLVCLGITYFGGFTFKETSTMGSFSNVVSLGMSFLGGIFVPLELLGDTMKNIARFTPTYWYIQSNNAIIGVEKFSDINIEEFAMGCGVQILFAAAFFCIGLAVLKHKRAEA